MQYYMFRQSRAAVFLFTTKRPIVVIIGILACLLTFFSLKSWYDEYRLKDEIRRLEYEVRSLQHRRLESLDILAYVMSDAYVSEAARTELHLRIPGESVAVLETTTTNSITPSPAIFSSTVEGLSNYKKWWYYFMYHSLPQ